MADVPVRIPVFTRTAAALALVALELHKQRKRERMWRREWLARKEERIEVVQLLQELHLED